MKDLVPGEDLNPNSLEARGFLVLFLSVEHFPAPRCIEISLYPTAACLVK